MRKTSKRPSTKRPRVSAKRTSGGSLYVPGERGSLGESVLHAHVRELLDDMGLTRLVQVEREYRAVAGRRFRWDLALIEPRLLVEVQGGVWLRASAHTTGEGVTRDCEKLSLAVAGGWRQISLTTTQVRNGMAKDVLREALAYEVVPSVKWLPRERVDASALPENAFGTIGGHSE